MTGERHPEAVSLPAVGNGQDAELIGDAAIPDGAPGLVVFAHGSGSSRRSERNRWVADQVHDAGLGTLLMDLLTPEEGRADEVSAHLRFDIDLLTRRVLGVLDWIAHYCAGLKLGLFGASTGAAAALGAASRRTDLVSAVVSRGGRPDLTPEPVKLVAAPTLLIVGGRDERVLELNRSTAAALHAPHEVRVVEGATHLFEEAGALRQVAEAAADWFRRHLG